MADVKLFNIKNEVTEYKSSTVHLEKELQTVIENNMDTFFGVTFLASEYVTTNGGRMDSIGIDENYCPVIFEYKRNVNESVINQGLFYLDWLLDHKDSFKVLVFEKLGVEVANEIDWSMPRVMCIAADFTKYDEFAINQMPMNISLIRYRKFGDDLLMFEQINENIIHNKKVEAPIVEKINAPERISETKNRVKTINDQFDSAEASTISLYEELENYILGLGDDVGKFITKRYIAFKKIKNFSSVVLRTNFIIVWLSLDVTKFPFETNFSRDVTNKGHWGTGNVEITIKNKQDLEKAKVFIEQAYNEN